MLKITPQNYKNIRKKNFLPKYLLEQGIHIVMPEKAATQWLRALRSGKYTQAIGTLYFPANGGFCCLGVQQKCAVGKIEVQGLPDMNFATIKKLDNTDYLESENYPSLKYLRSQGIFYGKESGSEDQKPYIPSRNNDAAELNDNGHSFDEMADLLEKHMAVY